MLIPHLLFAHMIADYTLQTNWLVVRKGQSWDGLALHGLMVYLMSLLVLPGYIPQLIVPLTAMALIHTFQDWVKVYTGPRIKVHPFIPYMIDQFLHYTLIIIIQVIYGNQLVSQPSHNEQLFMAAGAVAIAVTRFYDVTWWANWLDMIPFMNRWQVWGYAERLAMAAVSFVGLWYLAPLLVLPRVIFAWRVDVPLWEQPRGKIELPLGVVFSIALGLLLRAFMLSGGS